MEQIAPNSLQELEEYVKRGITLIDFYATWCGPCRTISPILEELSFLYSIKSDCPHNFYKIDIDEISGSNIFETYTILSLPTVLIFKNGDLIEKVVGAQPKKTYIEAIDKVKNSKTE